MNPITQTTIINEMLEPLTEALTPESAGALASFKVSDSIQQRVDTLAEKSNEGTLSDEERCEYETFVKYGNVLSIIKAKAKAVLANNA